MSQQLHSKLVNHIIDKGQRFPKKHGNWYYLPLTDNLWFELDSWNRSVVLSYGTPDFENCYWSGFGGKRLTYVGIDFGYYESRLNEAQYNEIISLLK